MRMIHAWMGKEKEREREERTVQEVSQSTVLGNKICKT